jgi:hypothetical protein
MHATICRLFECTMYIIHVRLSCILPAVIVYLYSACMCKGTLWQVFIGVYRLGYRQSCWYFLPQRCKLLPLSPSLWFNSCYFELCYISNRVKFQYFVTELEEGKHFVNIK